MTLQGSVAFTWVCIAVYWFVFLNWDYGPIMACIIAGVAIALCLVPCCVSSGSEDRSRARASPRERLKWWRPRFSLQCGVLTYALLAFLAMLAAWNCLSGQDASATLVRQSFAKYCDEDCLADLRYTLRNECEAALETQVAEEAAAAETIGEVVAAEEAVFTPVNLYT